MKTAGTGGLNKPLSGVAAFIFVRPAPPDTIVITSGAEGSIYKTNAEKLQQPSNR